MDKKKKDKLLKNLDEIIINNKECYSDTDLFKIYIYLISTITDTDKYGIMNQKAIQNLFLALEMPVLSVEVIISTLIFLYLILYLTYHFIDSAV